MLNYLNISPDLESKEILKLTIKVSRELAEFKTEVKNFTSHDILFNLLNLIDAKFNLAIENKETSFDNIYKEVVGFETLDRNAKFVIKILDSHRHGNYQLHINKLLTIGTFSGMQYILVNNKAGLRKVPGLRVRDKNGEVIYYPPKMYDEVYKYMLDFERLSNDSFITSLDPIVKQALLHSQFIAIQPFIDSSNIMARMMTSLYFTKDELLSKSIFTISPYFYKNKKRYNKLIHNIKMNEDSKEWILFYLQGVLQSAIMGKKFLKELDILIRKQHNIIFQETNFYSKKLRNCIIKYPFVTINTIVENLGIHRQTSSSYLKKLCQLDILKLRKNGRNNFYENIELMKLINEFHF